MQNFGGANKVHYGRCASDESSYLDQTSLVNKVFILLPSYHGFHSQRFVLLLFSILRVGRPPRHWFISFSRLPFPASFASTLNVSVSVSIHHCSKRVGDVDPGDVVSLHTSHHSHHGLGGYSKIINGLRAAASGTFVCLRPNLLFTC